MGRGRKKAADNAHYDYYPVSIYATYEAYSYATNRALALSQLSDIRPHCPCFLHC
jgi:hypothetical protein